MAKRIAIVEKSKCHPGRCGQECIKHDPLNRSGAEGFHIGEDGKATIAEELVMDAHSICAKKCPFHAIKIVKLPEILNQQPLHQYGQNGFRVFNVSAPLPNKVVGLLGRNGIGKSTLLKVLSGMIKPNLGDFTKEPEDRALIEFCKGSEAQSYFERLHAGEIVCAFKPQGIEFIPQQFSGTVHDMLSKVTDDQEKINEVMDKLDLAVLKDRKLDQISGGELQRLAIGATALKEADVYFFDEPTSFLDIYQRLEVSKFIRSLAKDGKSVVVIEHDLIILDAIADMIHIVYGEDSAFGVISQPKATKSGINMYLEGMLPQENIRFRPTAISFKKGKEKGLSGSEELIQWPAMEKQLGNFKLQIKEGNLFKHEVVGVLGQNGIGKTTFVKLLAGEIDPDTGKLDNGVKVAYKPQYLDTKSDAPVALVLQRAVEKYNALLIKPLDLGQFMNRQLNELSGGQLQRVAIAACLAEDAELFLLDEPSAYLDAEQRLLVSKVINDFMLLSGKTAIVVDHDLLFIDYLSDRLFVCAGSPGEHGTIEGPFTMQEGMNGFLKQVGITFRRDEESKRPRSNKPGSQIDQKQRSEGIWYYV